MCVFHIYIYIYTYVYTHTYIYIYIWLFSTIGEVGISPVIRANSGLHAELLLTICVLLGESCAITKRCRSWVTIGLGERAGYSNLQLNLIWILLIYKRNRYLVTYHPYLNTSFGVAAPHQFRVGK